MKRLSELVEKISDIDEVYGKLLSQPEVKAVLKRYESEIDLSKLPSFITAIDEFFVGVLKCNDCKQLANCKQPIRGHFPMLTPCLGRLRLGFTPCQYFKSEQHLSNIQTLHMPKPMANASFATLNPDANREELFRLGMDFVSNYKQNNFKKGIYLHGSMGSGKTYAMCAIANELAKRGISCTLVYFPELIAKIKAGFNDKDNPSDTIVDQLKTIPVLMLDDVGSEVVTSWMRDEILGRILNHRMMHELPTFFTSNFNLKELQKHYEQTNRNEYEPVKAARILERIKSISTPVALVGRNYRNEV